MQQQRITDDLEVMIDVLPPSVAEAVRHENRGDQLLEIVLDLGRLPEARYTDSEATLCTSEVTPAEIDYVVSRISAFDADNRAGIERTLHRISAIRNRRGNIVGMTCRVGRAVYGTIDIIEDIIASGKSILMLGKPGVGKTTMLREAARVLADKKRVVIVDTSNEIGGDGDIPHPAVGRARRMQVPQPSLQHEVMIEAVENHMPEVIVIDEIGRELEAQAARTIAERGVQLIGTAHGRTLDNLLMNPTLSDLVGGIESVTLSDEEARRRGTQKTVLERRAPPTFDVLIEIQDRQKLLVHHDVASSVDNLVRGRVPETELRWRDDRGHIHRGAPEEVEERPAEIAPAALTLQVTPPKRGTLKPVRVYAYGIAHNRLEQAATRLRLPVVITDEIGEADIVMTVKNYYRRRPKLISDAEKRNTPIYVLRANTLPQMENCLADIFGLSPEETDPYALAMQETQQAIRRVLAGERAVDLSPQNAFIRRQQHDLIRESNLISHSYGKEPMRRVRVYRE